MVYFAYINLLQPEAAMTGLKSTRNATRFIKNKFVGLQQSTDVCLTTPLWPSLMTTFFDIFLALSCRLRGIRALRGLD